MKTTEELLEIIYNQHDVNCNQKYGKYPYSYHLKKVVEQVEDYYVLLPNVEKRILLLSAAGHDLIEDARMTYNDLIPLLGLQVAEIIYSCTEEKGRNRLERHSDKFFLELRQNKLGVFIKLCDILANVNENIATGSTMFNRYQKEFPNLKSKLYIKGEFDLLWKNLEKLLNQ